MATKKTVAKKTTSKPAASAKSEPEPKKAAKPKTSSRQAVPAKTAAKSKVLETSPASLLERAEADMTNLLESLNTQMAAAMHVFAELAAAQKGRQEAVIRTQPLDRATAMFQRLVTELIDERVGQILPTVVALRSEMDQRAQVVQAMADSDGLGEFFTRGTEMLDQVLNNFDVHVFQPKAGDAFDPLIHLAVGETRQSDLADDVVSEVLQPGYRSDRGKVVQAARIKVNRR